MPRDPHAAPDDYGPLIEEFRPRAWAKRLTAAVFSLLLVAGLLLMIFPIAASLMLPGGPPLLSVLPLSGVGLFLAVVGFLISERSRSWVGHRVAVHKRGIVRHWSGREEFRPWSDVREASEMVVTLNRRPMPHLTVKFHEGRPWEFDEEYVGYERLRDLIAERITLAAEARRS
jgi:hypothetical protein